VCLHIEDYKEFSNPTLLHDLVLERFVEPVLKDCRELDRTWPHSQQWGALKALLALFCTSRSWWGAVGGSTEWAELRLAFEDLEEVGSLAWILHDPEMFVVEQFLCNRELLETSRRFATHVSPRILVAPIGDLELLELVALRDALFGAYYNHDIICEAEPCEDM
jgi:hypothetical protein